MSNSAQIAAAIIGSGNIGTDLMIKILRHGQHLQMAAMVGIDPASDGLARANRLGVATTSEGIDGLLALPDSAKSKWFLTPLRPGRTRTTISCCNSTVYR
jgi:acetaldehyde dehydrogenase